MCVFAFGLCIQGLIVFLFSDEHHPEQRPIKIGSRLRGARQVSREIRTATSSSGAVPSLEIVGIVGNSESKQPTSMVSNIFKHVLNPRFLPIHFLCNKKLSTKDS